MWKESSLAEKTVGGIFLTKKVQMKSALDLEGGWGKVMYLRKV